MVDNLDRSWSQLERDVVISSKINTPITLYFVQGMYMILRGPMIFILIYWP